MSILILIACILKHTIIDKHDCIHEHCPLPPIGIGGKIDCKLIGIVSIDRIFAHISACSDKHPDNITLCITFMNFKLNPLTVLTRTLTKEILLAASSMYNVLNLTILVISCPYIKSIIYTVPWVKHLAQIMFLTSEMD